MAKESASDSNHLYGLNNYSIANLLDLMDKAGAEKAILEVGWTPILIKQGQRIEIEGPDVTSEVMAELVKTVTDSRQLRHLRDNATVDLVRVGRTSQFLARIVDAFGVFRLDLQPIRNS